MLVYREKDNLIHKLHPVTMVALVGVIFLLALVFSHPVYLLGLLLAVGAVIIAAGHLPEWKGYLKFTLSMIIVIMIINGLVVQAGKTVLISGPRIPLLGKLDITLEALAYGAGMGIRLLVIISSFCLYTYAVHPDKVMKLFSRWGNKSVLVMTLSTRLFPLMVDDCLRIMEVQRCRGIKFDSGRWWERARKIVPVISVLLVSSLERSLQMAESMHARGYGSGTRSVYTRELWRPRDYLILGSVMLSLMLGIWAAVQGWSSYSYYPRLASIDIGDVAIAGLVAFILAMPVFLDWGWKKWPLLKSKI